MKDAVFFFIFATHVHFDITFSMSRHIHHTIRRGENEQRLARISEDRTPAGAFRYWQSLSRQKFPANLEIVPYLSRFSLKRGASPP